MNEMNEMNEMKGEEIKEEKKKNPRAREFARLASSESQRGRRLGLTAGSLRLRWSVYGELVCSPKFPA